jgi:hypothetical protein
MRPPLFFLKVTSGRRSPPEFRYIGPKRPDRKFYNPLLYKIAYPLIKNQQLCPSTRAKDSTIIETPTIEQQDI